MSSNKIFKKLRLKNKIAIVVGGSGQIGKQTINILLEAGATVINLDYLNYIVKNKKYFFKKIDITNEKQIVNYKKEFLKKFKRLDILINHAHYRGNPKKLDPNNNFFSSLDVYPTQEWKNTISVNLNGMFYLTKHFISILSKNRSSVILNTSSTYGKVSPNKKIYGKSGINIPIGYAMSKAGIIGFTKYLSGHYADEGVRANVLVLGGVENINQTKEFKSNYSKLTHLGRMAKQNEYKEAILFLVSDASSYMTGSEFVIDGGWTAW